MALGSPDPSPVALTFKLLLEHRINLRHGGRGGHLHNGLGLRCALHHMHKQRDHAEFTISTGAG